MSNGRNEKDYRNSGYINIKWDEESKTFQVSGNWTGKDGKQWDLGYAKTGAQGLQAAIQLIASQMGPTLAGKGVERQEMRRG